MISIHLPDRLRWARGLAGLCVVGVLVALPLWRHRVLVHRPPYEVYFALHDVMMYTSDYATALALLVGWWAVLRGPRSSFHVGPWYVVLPLTVLVMLTLLSPLWAVDPYYAGYQALRLVIGSGFYLLLVNLHIPVVWLGLGAAASVVLQAGVALGQVVAGRSIGLAWLGEVPLDPIWSGVSVLITPEGRSLRAYGLTQHPNLLGGLLVALLLLLVGLGARASTRSRKGLRALLILTYVLGAIALLFTFSRGAWVAALTGGATMLALLARSRSRSWSELLIDLAPYIAMGAVVVAVFAGTQWDLLSPRLGLEYSGAEIRSVDERVTLLTGARALRGMRPLLGVGAGGFSTALFSLVPHALADYPIFQPVHRVPMLLAAELGPMATLAWVGLMVGPGVNLLLTHAGDHCDSWLAGLSAILIAFFTVGWFEAYPWASQQGMLMTWFTLGAWVRAYYDLTRPSLSLRSESYG